LATVDAGAFHPYGTTFLNTGSRIEALRDWLDQHGAEALPIEITETGWATPPLPEDVRATRMATLVAGLPGSSCDVARFIAQTWLTPDVDASDPNDFFGIANADATLKPTGVAFVDAIAAVEHGTAQATSDPCAGRVATTTSDGSTPTSPAPSDPAPSAPAPAPAGSVPDPASAPPASILSATAVLPASPPATAAALGPSPPHVSVRVTRRDRRTLVVAIACAARRSSRRRAAGSPVASGSSCGCRRASGGGCGSRSACGSTARAWCASCARCADGAPAPVEGPAPAPMPAPLGFRHLGRGRDGNAHRRCSRRSDRGRPLDCRSLACARAASRSSGRARRPRE